MRKEELERVEGIIGRYGGATECEVWVTAVEPNGDWEAPGHWPMHTVTINLSIVLRKESDDKDLILDKLRSGNFTVDLAGADFCDGLGDNVLDKDSIIYEASKAKDLDQFIKNIQDEVYDATLDWYRDNYTVDPDDYDEDYDIWNGDGINDDALYEITEMGGKGFKVG